MLFAAVVLLGMVVFASKSRVNYERLPELIAEPWTRPDVTAIVPARNEAHQIGRCVASLGCPVIVVDDASTDGTGVAASRAGARVIPAPPLNLGVLGKPNACAAGARECQSEWLLFVDADTCYAPSFVAQAVAYAERESLDVLTAFLQQERVSLAERTILPYAFALYFAGVNADRVNSPNSTEALANGQCLLFRRSAYERIGGHDAVRTSVIEDVALARLAKQHGLRLRVVRAERLGFVRMYDGLGSIWRGLEKNSFRFLKVNPWTGAQVVLASICLTSWLPALVLADQWWVRFAVALAPSLLLAKWYGWRDAALAPFGIYVFQLIALSAMVKSLAGGTTKWKGRDV